MSAGSDTPLIIKGKLRPPPLPDHFSARPRMERLITRLLAKRRVLIVTAAAGSGKTTAVADALSRTRRPLAWLTVDHPDQAAGRLLTYLEASLESAVPGVHGAASGALAAGIPHAEAAGLLAESLGDGSDQPVVVLDELERLGMSSGAWLVLAAILRHAPTGTSFVLISRRDIPSDLCALPSPAATAVLNDADLAFTPEEAEAALARSGRGGVDVAALIGLTGGWVTGVMFETWRSSGHVVGPGNDTGPMSDYISSQILGQLDEAQRELLIRTSVLDEVTAARAEGLGLTGAEATMASLRTLHLPVVWDRGGATMRCQTYLRDHLLERLERRDGRIVAALRLAHGHMLMEEGHDEEATEEFLRIDAHPEARVSAERAIVGVVERLDLSIAERWLARLGPETAVAMSSSFVTAELLLAIARDEIGRGVQFADALTAAGQRNVIAAGSERAALLMVWCYFHVGRLDEVDDLLNHAGSGPAALAMRFARDALFGDGAAGFPTAPTPLPAGPFEAIVCNADYALGRLEEVFDGDRTGWVQRVEGPWRTATLRARGRTEAALALVEEALRRGFATPTMLVFAAPEVLMDAGRWDEARELIARARRGAAVSGSLAYTGFCSVLTAKLELRGFGDETAALAALEEPACVQAAARLRFISEVADTWRGLGLLRRGENAKALDALRRAVDGMVAGDRMLELPTAAVYLAEACARTGDDHGSDAAAATALRAAERQGSNHLLLQALGDFPAVVARRLAFPDPRWQQLGQALMLQGNRVSSAPTPPVKLAEFGRRAITVGGTEVRPRIAKSYELLAYLAVAPGAEVTREALLDVLFEARRDDSARAYLRQTIHQLREVLPDGTVVVEDGRVRLKDAESVISESVMLERRLAEAARLQGEQRLTVTRDILGLYARGEYLPGPRGDWADERQRRISDMVTEARYQSAVLAYGAGAYAVGRDLLEAVLAEDPFREAAWRLEMRIAEALGDEAGVLKAYRGCEQALAELGTAPGASTRQLLERLRH